MIRHDAFNRHTILAPGITSHGFIPPGGDTQYAISFNATTTRIECGSDASLDDLHDGAMTAEAWVKTDGYGEGFQGRILSVFDGWEFYVHTSQKLVVTIHCATTDANCQYDSFTHDSSWAHVAFTWDDASFNYPKIWVGGTEVTPSSTTNRSGAIVSQTSEEVIIGNNKNGGRTFDGDIAWVRISDTVRYTTSFTPAAKDSPPDSDGNTVGLWHMNEGTGTSVEDETGTNDGTLYNGSWAEI